MALTPIGKKFQAQRKIPDQKLRVDKWLGEMVLYNADSISLGENILPINFDLFSKDGKKKYVFKVNVEKIIEVNLEEEMKKRHEEKHG